MSARGWAVPALLLLGAMMLALSPQGMAVGRGGETDASARVVVLEPEGTGDGAGARFAGVKGEVDEAGHRFLVENLSLFQPVEVGVLLDRPSPPLVLELYKYRFDQPLRTYRTDAKGGVLARLRTQGDLRIAVRAQEGRVPFTLVVRVGEEVEPRPLQVFIPTRTGAGEGGVPGPGGGRGWTGWLVGLLVLVAAGWIARRTLQGRKGR